MSSQAHLRIWRTLESSSDRGFASSTVLDTLAKARQVSTQSSRTRCTLSGRVHRNHDQRMHGELASARKHLASGRGASMHGSGTVTRFSMVAFNPGALAQGAGFIRCPLERNEPAPVTCSRPRPRRPSLTPEPLRSPAPWGARRAAATCA